MKIGEIKIAALKLMFAAPENGVSVDDLPALYEDGNYSYLLNSMPEAIQRALDRFAVNGLYEPIMPLAEGDGEELRCPEQLARLIPYAVKADLYEEDNPSMAAQARNIFESQLSEYIRLRPDIEQADKIEIVV